MRFDDPDMLNFLVKASDAGTLDELDFGVIGFNEDDEVTDYNAFEANAAGLSKSGVLERDLFTEVAPCMNNFMISGRFDDEDEIDEVIDYVLTLKMKPTKVRLRLLKSPSRPERFILLNW